MPHHGLGPIRFASYLALAWLGLVVYGSLHPFAGWRDTGVSPFAFLEGGWPRYWTVFDLAANVAVYLPLGFFLGLALSRLRGRFTGMALATLLAGAIIIENVFYLPGLGRMIFQAITQRDLIVVQGAVLVLVAAVILVTFLVDLGYALIDPRLRK